MTKYNVAVRVGYNGAAVSKGAAQNQRDIQGLTAATRAQGQASAVTARQNQSLVSSYGAMAGAVSIFAGIGFGRQLISDATASELLTTRINNLAGSSERAAEIQAYLVKTSGELNTRYSQLAGSYARLIVLENQKTLTTEESRKVLEGMADVAKTVGASNVQVEQSMYGLTQALTSGTVRAEELNQIMDALPSLLQAVDKAAGLPANGFRKLVTEGKVTSDFLKTTLLEAFKEFEGAAAANAKTMSASFANLGTQYDLLVKQLEAPINAAVTPVINSLADSLSYLKDNTEVLETAATTAGALATVIAGKLMGSLASATQATIANMRASQAKILAEREAAATALSQAQAEYKKATAANVYTLSSTRATAATAALSAATARYNTVAKATAVSTRALSGAMALVGGPVGVITIAAISLLAFSQNADDASRSASELTSQTKALNEEQAKLNPFRNYTKRQATSALGRFEVMLKDAETAMEEARLRANHSNSEVDIFYLNEAEAKLLNLQTKVAQIRSQLTRFDEQTPASNSASSQNQEFASQLDQLQRSLLTEEESIKDSWARRQAILNGALSDKLLSEESFASLSQKLVAQKEQAITELEQKKEQERLDLAKARAEEEQRQLEMEYENKLATIQGFYDRKALLEFQNEQRILDEVNQRKIDAANGFDSEEQKREHARQEGLLKAQTRRTGVMQKLLFSQAEWERKNELEKTEAMLEIGEFGFKQMAGQSKKAFAMYKAFSIGKAVMNTYEMATGAYNALANIPVVGPVLGAAAAAGAIAYGMNQVRTIKNQQYSAQYHGGRDYIPNEQTALLQRGERVVSPRQNVALTKAVDTILSGDKQASGGINITYSPHIEVSSSDSLDKANELEQAMYERFEANLVAQFRQSRGPLYSAVRSAA